MRDLVITALDRQDLESAFADLRWQDVEDPASAPEEKGVYAWVGRLRHVLYIGSASGAYGLRGRIRTHVFHRTRADELSVPDKRDKYMAAVAGLSEHGASVICAVTPNAIEVEATLLAYSTVMTGTTPLLNGGGWDWTVATKAASERALEIYRRRTAPPSRA